MIFDVASYGLGLGCVMIGWLAGMMVNYALVLVGRLGSMI